VLESALARKLMEAIQEVMKRLGAGGIYRCSKYQQAFSIPDDRARIKVNFIYL
jgi:hypothetical protein